MRIASIALAASLAAIPALAQQPGSPDPFAPLDLQRPECVRQDAGSGAFLISNVNGPFTATDDNGFISRVPAEGDPTLKWISGADEEVVLHAPKGMEIHDGKLYVADVDHLRIFDLTTGAEIRSIAVPGARFLNGVAIVPDGPIYVTDSGTTERSGAVYAIRDDGTVDPITAGIDIARPNGIAVGPEGWLWVASFADNKVLALSPEGEILAEHAMPAGQLDGLVASPDGHVLVSSWQGHAIYRLAPDGTVETLVTGLVQPACFTVAEVGGELSLVIPQVKPNRIAVAPVSALPIDLAEAAPKAEARPADAADAPADEPSRRTVTATPADTARPIQPSPAPGGGTVLASRISARHGPYLIDGAGRTVYLFEPEKPAGGGAGPEIKCTKACAEVFPPVIVDGAPGVTEAAKQDLAGTVLRPDGRMQATYGGWPLYHYVGDRGSGKASAAEFGKPQFGGTWHLVGPDGKPAGEKVFPDDRFSKLDFKHPECVRYEPQQGFYLVSNVNGTLTDADNNGFITRIEKSGLSVLKWIEGGKNGVTLNAPAGMQIEDGRLYVADIDHLRVFDLATGNPVGAARIPGAQLLNDLAIGEDAVYITDSGTKDGRPGAVYKVTGDGTVTKIVPGRVIARPDGIDFDDQGQLHVTEFAGDQVFTISTDGEILGKTKLASGQLDGIVVRPDGDVLVSSWNGQQIVRITPDGKPETIVTGLTTPACFDVEDDKGETVLLIPEFDRNKVTVTVLPSRG